MRRSPLPVALATMVALFLGGCSHSTPRTAPAPSATTATSPVATAPTTSPAPSSPSPAPSPTATIFTTPTAAAKHLYAAWKAGDRTAAALGATPAAVSALFAHSSSGTYFFGGCSGTTECDYNYSAGAVQMIMSGDATAGFTVSTVRFGNAG